MSEIYSSKDVQLLMLNKSFSRKFKTSNFSFIALEIDADLTMGEIRKNIYTSKKRELTSK